MAGKMDILLHPVRVKIIRALMQNNIDGLTPLEMVKVIGDVPQATLYRHIQVLEESDIIRVLKEHKVRAVSEKTYVMNMDEVRVREHEWENISDEDKLNHYSTYQLLLLNQYQNYLAKLKEKSYPSDNVTFSMMDLKLDDQAFENFQTDLNNLVMKYYNESTNDPTEKTRTIGITIIPET